MKKSFNASVSQLIPVKTDKHSVIICPNCGGKVFQYRGAVVLHQRPIEAYDTAPVRISLDIDDGVNIQGLPNGSIQDDNCLQICLQYICSECSDLEDFYRLVVSADFEGFTPQLGWIGIG